MAARLTYSGTPFYDQIMKEGFKAGKPTGGFSTRLADYFQSGAKTFSSPSKGVASLYGKTVPMVSSASNLRLPSGGIPGKTLGEALRNLTGTRVGTEVIQTPGQANRGMKFASKLGTKYTGPTAQRMLAGQTVSGIGASQAGKSVLGRVLGAALGPAATYASALTAPNMIMASMLDGPNVRSGAADRFAGMMGEAMLEEDYAPYSELLGMPEASQALDDEYYDFDEVPSTQTTQASSPRALGAEDIKEEGIFSLGDILADLGRKGVEGFKDVAGRGIASQALGRAGTMIAGPLIGGIASLAGLFGGGNMFGQSYDNSFKEFATPDMSPYGMGSPGLSHLQDKYGKNTVSARGNYGKMALNTFINLTERSKKGPLSKHLQGKKDYYGNIVNKINSKLTDSNDYGGGPDGGNTGYGGYGSSAAAAAGAAATGGRDYSNSPGAVAGDMEYGEE